MLNRASIEELQGNYDISYQSNPPVEGFYEPGYGSAQIRNHSLIGIDALGVNWNATLKMHKDGTITFEAILDPSTAPETVGLMSKSGTMTREKQTYSGELRVIKTNNELILSTTVQQGPIAINVQFRKRS